jgi:hypothetical protein
MAQALTNDSSDPDTIVRALTMFFTGQTSRSGSATIMRQRVINFKADIP